jgi:threonine aldolase
VLLQYPAIRHQSKKSLLDIMPMNERSVDTTMFAADFRSDTVTKPCEGMRAAMASASVGDDVFRDDPTVNELQDRIASMLGFHGAIFLPTGTMSNL